MQEKPTDDEIVQTRRDGPVAIVTLNYPQRRNAFSLQMRQRLCETLYSLEYLDTECRAIVLTGAGKAFCAGGDISEMQQRRTLELRERNLVSLDIFRLLAAGPRPVVAAVEGFAMGAGVSLAAACDYAVVARNARLGCSFVKVGLLPDCGLYWSLAQRVGAGLARELMLSGREFSGEESFESGFANRLVDPGQALEAALEVAREYAALPPLALAHLKAALASGCDTLDKAIETEVNLQPLLRRSEDHREAAAAFMAKRPAAFVGN